MAGSFTNLYTEKRPQHVNIHFYEDLDSGKSFIHLSGNYKNNSSDPEPLIEPLSSFVNTQDTRALTPFTKEYVFRYCLLYTSPSPRDQRGSRMPSSA